MSDKKRKESSSKNDNGDGDFDKPTSKYHFTYR